MILRVGVWLNFRWPLYFSATVRASSPRYWYPGSVLW